MVRLKEIFHNCLLLFVVFQFHNGSIKGHGDADKRASGAKFQFHNGSIKGQYGKVIVVVNKVSIPQWFD